MADIRRVPLLLVILFAAAIGGYFVIKSQIQKNFVIAEIPNVVVQPVLEFNTTQVYDYRTGAMEWYGDYPFAVFSYYYNNTPYALVVGVSFSGLFIDKVYVRLYNLLSKSVVSEKIIEYPEGYGISLDKKPFYYIDKSGRLVATIPVDVSTEAGESLLVYKVVVDKGNITEFKPVFPPRAVNYPLEGGSIYQAIVFEGVGKDYVVLVGTVTSPINPWYRNTEIVILDDLGNILYSFVDNNTENNVPYNIIAYETNNTVVFAVGVSGYYPEGTLYTPTYSIIYDKNTKIYRIDFARSLDISSYPDRTIVGYGEDIIFLRTTPVYGYVRGMPYLEYLFLPRGWIKGDRILGIHWQNNYPVSYEVIYRLFNYTFTDDGISLYVLAEGLFMNFTPPFFNGTGDEFDILWTNKYVEVLGLSGNYLPILYIARESGIRQEYAPGLVAETEREAEYVALVDLDNYKIYNIKISDIQQFINVTIQGDLGIIKVVGPVYFTTDNLLVKSLYHPRFLIPVSSVIATEIRNVTTYEPISANLTIRTVVYMLTTVIQQPKPQPQPSPQPSGGVTTTVIPPSENVTNVTNVTTQIPVQAAYPTIPTWVTVLAGIIILMIILYYLTRAR